MAEMDAKYAPVDKKDKRHMTRLETQRQKEAAKAAKKQDVEMQEDF
jgi:hypothetical protein